jgi:hypothetical protein
LFIEQLYHIDIYLDTGRLAEHVYLQEQARGISYFEDYPCQVGERPGYNPASLAGLDIPIRRQRRAGSQGALNLHKLFDQRLLVVHLDQAGHPVCSQQLNALALIAAEEQIAAKERQKRPEGPAALAANLPGHRQKVADVSMDQIVGQSLFISAFGMGDPPPPDEITNRLGAWQNYRWIFTCFEQPGSPASVNRMHNT